ncbi:TPA: hypothetical protein HA273_00130 [Candidatus Bathyarchaeota archaeon]|nr:hypothetical protein [Candidatus Bathyarchaeota archaeon]
MPVPTVRDGKWSKERERTKSGRWRRKRSDANQPRKKQSNLKYAFPIAAIGIIAIALIVVFLYFPSLLRLPW